MVIGLNQLDHHSPMCNDNLNNCDLVMKENDGRSIIKQILIDLCYLNFEVVIVDSISIDFYY